MATQEYSSFFGYRNSRAFAKRQDARDDVVTAMNEVDVIRLNVERYRRMLQTEADESARRAIQQMLREFEAKLSSARPLSKPAAQLIHIKAEMFRQR